MVCLRVLGSQDELNLDVSEFLIFLRGRNKTGSISQTRRGRSPRHDRDDSGCPPSL